MKLLITCEHASADIPKKYRSHFTPHQSIETHRIFDPGAEHLAELFSKKMNAPVFSGKTTRLLADLNRTPENPKCISPLLSGLSLKEKEVLISVYHRPHWKQIFHWIQKHSAKHKILHIAVHSFTPVWDSIKRPTDIGLLYDPRRPFEKEIASVWRKNILNIDPKLTVHLNRPYRGWTDGITNSLRQSYGPDRYVGFELEVNQKFCRNNNTFPTNLEQALIKSVHKTLILFN